MSTNNAFNTIEDYVAFWQTQSLEALQTIATEHMGGYNPTHTKDELVAYLTKGMEDHCADQASRHSFAKEQAGGDFVMTRPMRRADRQVTDFAEIADILRRTDTIRLGLNAEPYPYVVPLSFGFQAVDGAVTLYFHGAKEGFKHDLIAANPHVCVEADIFHGYKPTERSVTTEYESFIGFGKAALVFGDEAIKGLDLLLTHCGYDGFTYDHGVLDAVSVYKITLDEFTAKHRFAD